MGLEVIESAWDYVFSFTTILLGCELMFCLTSQRRRPHFWRNLLLTVPLYCVLLNSNVVVRAVYGTWLIVLNAVPIFVASVLVLWALFDASLRTCVFYACAAYSVEGILFVVRYAPKYFSFLPTLDFVSSKLVIIAGCGLVLLPIWLFLVPRYGEGRQPDVDNTFMLVFVIGTLFVANFLSSWVRIEKLQSAPYALCSVLCYVLLLMVQFGAFQISSLERERDYERRIFHMHEVQQRQSQESMEVINIKFHDLKHQIAAMRQVEGVPERERYLDELAHSVDVYDTAVRSGDPAVDAILTEKSMHCWARGIDFTCIVDGPSLAWMGVVDLYTLLGNALDNAIEAADKVPSHMAQVVSVQTHARGDLLAVVVENSCVGRVELADGMPATDKLDHAYHGFGLRSIREVIERHGGNLSLAAEDGRFCLTALFPVPAANGDAVAANGNIK